MPKTALDLLKDMHGREHGVMTGSGTSALVLALWALGLHGKRVAIPNGVCYSVPLAVLLSGNEPVYLDIDRETLSLGVEQLRKYGRWYDAVIAVHNYGARCDIDGIAFYCREQGLPLVEDCCVALGAEGIGCWGDASVFSFGAGKIVDAGGGGALLCDDGGMAGDVERMERCLGEAPHTRLVGNLSALHTRLYNRFWDGDRRRLSVFGEVAQRCRRDLLWRKLPMAEHGSVYDGLKGLEMNVGRRAELAYRLRDRLLGVEGTWHRPPSGSVFWRFNIFIEEGRDDLMRHLHAKGYDASSWHAPADLFFGERIAREKVLTINRRELPRQQMGSRRGPGSTLVTDWVADRILNLWVDHTVGEEYVEGVSGEVREWLGTR